MYRVSWSTEQNGGAVSGSEEVQYLADVHETIRFAFGSEGAKFVVIAKED